MEIKTQPRHSLSPSVKPNQPPQEPQKAGDLEELLKLLLGEERKKIGALEHRLDNLRVEAQDVSEVLPKAIELLTSIDGRLARALRPSIIEALESSAHEDPKPLTEALFPLMGPAMRRSLWESLAKLVQTFNQTLEKRLSPQALQWRWEAFRTGKPYADVLLRHTQLGSVEQLFLIHGESGHLLQHAALPGAAAKEPAAVSGILAAIQDFELAHRTSRNDSLHTLEAGDLLVWVERGPLGTLAAAIRGTPSPELQSILKGCLDRIHAEMSGALRSFQGVVAPFDACQPELQACLEEARKDGRTVPKKSYLGPAVLAGGGVLVILWALLSWRSSTRWNGYVEELKSAPGIEVTEFVHRSGQYHVRGLKDPLAPDPIAILDRLELPRDELDAQWEPYCSLAPEIVKTRVKALLKPPVGVDVQLSGGTLILSGRAPHDWVARVESAAATIPGVSELKTDQLLSLGGDAELLSRVKTILKPPAGVELGMKDGVLRASGSSPHAWIAGAEQLVTLIPGLRGFLHSELVDFDERRLRELKESVERLRFSFQGGTAELSPDSREMLTSTVLKLDQLSRTTQELGRKLRISVLTTKEPESPESAPRGLEKLRAEALARTLSASGIDASSFTTTPAAEPSTKPSAAAEDSASAYAALRITFED